MGKDYGGGFYGAIEIMIILRAFANGNNVANVTVLILLLLQITGIISIIKSFNLIMAFVTIGLIIIMILGTKMSTTKIGPEIIPNFIFLIVASTYLVVCIRDRYQMGINKHNEMER